MMSRGGTPALAPRHVPTSMETLAADARLESEIRKSRFLALAAPVDSPAAALAWLDSVADRAATHNCWAYRIGEPSGTAGKPILAAIDGQQIDQVMVVVTRWYGGIKLGAGGLVRAYGGTAAECLRQAPRRTLIQRSEAWLDCDFAFAAIAHTLLAGNDATKLEEHYSADGLRLRIRVPTQNFTALAATLRDATRGSARLVRIDETDP